MTDVCEALPRNMTKPARLVALAAWMLREGEPGEIEGGQAALRALAGYEDPKPCRLAIRECEHFRILRRVSQTRRQKVFFLGFRESPPPGICPLCGVNPIRSQRGGRECSSCLQIVVRRGWRDTLLNLWISGCKQPGVTDWTIARRASAMLKRSLWTRADDDGQGAGSGEGEGIVPAGIALGIFSESMLDYDPKVVRGVEE